MADKIDVNIKVKEYEQKMKKLDSQIKSVEKDISRLKTTSKDKESLGRYKDDKTIERARQKIQNEINDEESKLHKLEQEYIKEKKASLSDKIYNAKKEIDSLKKYKKNVAMLPFVGSEYSEEVYQKKYNDLQKEIKQKEEVLIRLQEQKKRDYDTAIENELKQLRKNQRATKQPPKFRSLGKAGVRLMPGIEHEYEHTASKGDKLSQADKAKLDKMIDKRHRLSVTKIASILTQSDEDTLQGLLDSMKGKELTQEYKNIRDKLKEAKKIHSASSASSIRGTGFHKLAETIEKGGFTMDNFDISDKKALAKKIDELKALSKQSGYEDIDKALNTFDNNIKTVDDSAERLIKMAHSYESFKKEVGLKGQVTTERSVGFLTQIGDEWVEVVGTLDSFFNELKVLTDFKTGQSVDPKKIGIQTNLLKTALKTMGVDVKGMKALHIPYKDYREGGVYDVRDVDEDTIYQWISDAFNMYWGKQLQPTKDIPTLMQSKLEPYSFEKNGKTQHTWKLNKRTLKSLERDYDKGWISVDEVANMVEGLSPDDKKHFINLLWSTKKYGEDLPMGGVESNELYRKGRLWKELRSKIPSFYTGLKAATGISEESFIDEEGNVSGATTVGGGFLSQWSKAYRLKLAEGGEEAAQTVVDQFIKIVKDSTDEIGQEEVFGKLTSLSFKDEIHEAFIDAVDKSLFGEAGSQFYSGVDLEQVDALEAEVNTLQQKKAEISKLAAKQGNIYTKEQAKEFDNLTKKIQELQNQIERLSYSYTRSPMFSDEVGINERSKEENTERAIRSQKRAGERQYREQGRLISRLRGLEEADISGFDTNQLLNFIKGINSLKNVFKGALDEMGAGELSQLNEAGMSEFIDNSDYLLDRWYEFVQIIKDKISPTLKDMKGVAKETGDWKSFNAIENALNNLMLTEDMSALTTKTGHRFSWLYQAKDIYDEMLSSENRPSWMSPEKFAKLRLTPEQYKQYVDSAKLKQMALQSGGNLSDLVSNYLNIPGGGLYSDLGINVQKSLSKIMSGAPDLIGTSFYDIISKQTTLTGGSSAKMKWWEDSVNAIERLRRGEEIQAWTPDKAQNLEVSNVLTNKINDIIRNIVEEASGGKGKEAASKASLDLRTYLSQLGISGGPLNRLLQGDISAVSLTPALNTAAVQQNIKNLQDQKDTLSDEAYQTKLTELTNKLEEVNGNLSKYTELLNQSRTAYSKQTSWDKESLTEMFKDKPEKLERVMYLVNLLEQLQGLPAISLGERKQEQKTAETQVDSDKTEVVADTIVIGDSSAVTEKKKSTKRRGRPKKTKVETSTASSDVVDKMEVSSDGGAGGDGGGGEPPKSRGRKGKSDAEKAQAATEKQQKQDIREYQQYINKVISLESQIDKLQRQATLSGGKHKDAIYGTIDALNEELGDLNRNNDALVKRVAAEQSATKASIDATAELKKQSNAQKNLVSVKGATSIWDMMANDIRRATLRIADFGIAAKALNKIPQDIQKVIQYTKELDAAMTNIRIVSGKSMEEAQEFMRGLQQIAQKTGTTLSELASGANEWLDNCLGHYKLL